MMAVKNDYREGNARIAMSYTFLFAKRLRLDKKLIQELHRLNYRSKR